IFLAPSYPRSPPTPVVLTLWLSTMPARGWASRPSAIRRRSRHRVCIRSHICSLRQRQKGMIGGFPLREGVGGEPPLTACPQPVENGREEVAPGGLTRAAGLTHPRQQRFDEGPFLVCKS